jgi:hypothetical protein
VFWDLNNIKWRKWWIWSIVEHKTRFETWITRNDVNCVSLFNLSYLINLMVYLCWQWTPNVQNKFFMFVWSIYRRFVLNTGWKRDSFQIMIFVYICSTWNLLALKTRFEMWRTRNDVNGVSLIHFFLLNKLRAYLCLQRTPNVQIKHVMFDWSIYRLLVLNRGWKSESLQIKIYVYVSSTCSVVKLKTRFETFKGKNAVNGVCFYHFLFNNTYGLPVLTIDTKWTNQFFMIDFCYIGPGNQTPSK